MTHRRRRGAPSARYARQMPSGLVVLVSDAKGSIRIASDAQARLADQLRLPYATKPKEVDR